ncbi:hypothetical protein C8Q78DRAFT_1077552 [Trametes maxima]|nr:hypothetical protein C8Q78DRAFT_1077552 [Trametes maxima]
MTLQGPRLGRDVLLELLQHVPRQSDVSALMRTSKQLYEAGAKPLLAFGVTLTNDQQLQSFCDFISRDASMRAPSVQRLHLKFKLDPESQWDEDDYDEDDDRYEVEDDDDRDDRARREATANANQRSGQTPPSKAALDKLLKILPLIKNMEDLRIDWCEEFLGLKKKLVEPFISFERLLHLDLHSIGVLTQRILDETKSKPAEIDLSFTSDERYDTPELIPCLSRHRTSVETIRGSNAELGSISEPFPRVRTLALRALCDPDLPSLHQGFPNLTRLTLTKLDIQSADRMRKDNMSAAVSSPWGVLDHLYGSPEGLYILGTSPRVRKLEVEDISQSKTTFAQLHTVITEAHPSHLVLHLESWGSYDVKKVADLLPSGKLEVTHLVLDMSPWVLKGSAAAFLSGLLTLTRKASLEFLIVRLGRPASVEDPKSPGPVELDGSANRKLIEAFKSTHHSDIVRQLADAAPTLEHVVLEVVNEEARYWEVRHGDGGAELKELEGMVGRALVRAEGLAANDSGSW